MRPKRREVVLRVGQPEKRPVPQAVVEPARRVGRQPEPERLADLQPEADSQPVLELRAEAAVVRLDVAVHLSQSALRK